MTIDPPHDDEEFGTTKEVLAELAGEGISGLVEAENKVDEIHNGLGEAVTEDNPLDIDAERIASELAEETEDEVRKHARRLSRDLADEAGVEAGKEAYDTFLTLVRKESPRLNDTSFE